MQDEVAGLGVMLGLGAGVDGRSPEVEGGPGVILRPDDAPLHVAKGKAEFDADIEAAVGSVVTGVLGHVVADGPGGGEPTPGPSRAGDGVQGRGRAWSETPP